MEAEDVGSSVAAFSVLEMSTLSLLLSSWCLPFIVTTAVSAAGRPSCADSTEVVDAADIDSAIMQRRTRRSVHNANRCAEGSGCADVVLMLQLVLYLLRVSCRSRFFECREREWRCGADT
jgi:hypothetical protein